MPNIRIDDITFNTEDVSNEVLDLLAALQYCEKRIKSLAGDIDILYKIKEELIDSGPDT